MRKLLFIATVLICFLIPYTAAATLNLTIVTNVGIVLAADSRVTYMNEKGDYRIATDNAQKLFQIGKKAGLVTAGKTFIGNKNIISLIREFTSQRGIGDAANVPIDLIAPQLLDFLKKEHSECEKRINSRLAEISEGLSTEQDEGNIKMLESERSTLQKQLGELDSNLGILMSGYNNSDARKVYQLIVSKGEAFIGELRAVEPTIFWDGQTDVISRLVLGFDQTLVKGNVAPVIDEKVLDGLEYNVHFDKMTLKDAVEFALFLVETTMTMQRFADGTVGNPGGIDGTGGPIDIAVITPEGFSWVQKKGLVFSRELNSGLN